MTEFQDTETLWTLKLARAAGAQHLKKEGLSCQSTSLQMHLFSGQLLLSLTFVKVALRFPQLVVKY